MMHTSGIFPGVAWFFSLVYVCVYGKRGPFSYTWYKIICKYNVVQMWNIGEKLYHWFGHLLILECGQYYKHLISR